MKAFKLIKQYPNSPKLNFIVRFKEGFPNVRPAEIEAGCECNLNLQECEKFSEFWEEVSDLEFEILEFSNGFNKYYKLNNGNYKLNNGNFTINLQYEYLEKTLLSGKNDITKVKRLVDNEIFNIGDRTNNGIIKRFRLDGNMIRVYFTNKDERYNVNLTTINHIKPILTTEDSVDIYCGDSYYMVYTYDDFDITAYTIYEDKISMKQSGFIPDGGRKCFASKESAEKFIYLNKPQYSKQDIYNMFSLKSKSYISAVIDSYDSRSGHNN